MYILQNTKFHVSVFRSYVTIKKAGKVVGTVGNAEIRLILQLFDIFFYKTNLLRFKFSTYSGADYKRLSKREKTLH